MSNSHIRPCRIQDIPKPSRSDKGCKTITKGERRAIESAIEEFAGTPDIECCELINFKSIPYSALYTIAANKIRVLNSRGAFDVRVAIVGRSQLGKVFLKKAIGKPEIERMMRK